MDALRQLFIGSLNLAVAASWLIVVILLLRPLLKKFAPKWVLCGLWALVAIRLVCPVMLHSDVSAYRLAGDAVQSSGQVTYFEDTGFCGDVRYRPATLLPGVSAAQTTAASVPGAMNDSEGPAESMTSQPRTASRSVDMNVPAMVWAAGIYIMAMAALAGYLSLRSTVAASIPLEGNVYLCDNIKSPFILGVLQPRIYLTSGMDEAAKDCVLRHERAHLRRWDHVWKPLGFVLLAVYWYDPLVWAAYILFCRDMELACDERVIRDMAAEERAVYSQALLDCSRGRHWVAACPLAFGEVGVKTRVKAVLWYKKPGYWISAAAVLVCAAVAVCFLTNPKKQEEPDLSLANYQNVATLAAQMDYVTVTQSDGTVTTIPGTALSRLLSSADWMYQAAGEPDDASDNKYALMVQVDDSTAIRFYDGDPMEGARITAGDEIRWYYMGDMHVSDAAQALVQTDPLLLKLAAQADELDTFDIGWMEGDILYPDDDIPAPVLSRFLRSLDWQPWEEDMTVEILEHSGYQKAAQLVLGDSTLDFYEVPDMQIDAVVIHSGGADHFYTILNGFRSWLEGNSRYLGQVDQEIEIDTFGSYEQDGNTSNGKEPIEWLVLDRDGDKVLLLSKYALDYQSFMPFYEPVTEPFTWESSSLRRWLNGTFLNSAFSADERQRLLTTTVITSPGSLHRGNGPITTEDRVFLLSNTEVYAYFANEAATAAEYTAYALSENPWAGNAAAPGAADWWLRTTSGDHPDAVYSGGGVGEGVRAYEGAYVRPAIWITMPE